MSYNRSNRCPPAHTHKYTQWALGHRSEAHTHECFLFPSSPDNFYFLLLSVLTRRAPTCLAHSFHFLFLSTPSSLRFSCAAKCSTTGKMRALIPRTALQDLTALEFPKASYKRDRKGCLQTDGPTDRKSHWEADTCIQHCEHRSPEAQQRRLRQNILCSRNHYHEWVCVGVCSVWSRYFSEGNVRAWARSTETI